MQVESDRSLEFMYCDVITKRVILQFCISYDNIDEKERQKGAE